MSRGWPTRAAAIAVAALVASGVPSLTAGQDDPLQSFFEVLNYGPKHRERLRSGGIVVTDMDRRGEKELVASAAMLIPQPFAEFRAAVKPESWLAARPDMISFGRLVPPPDLSDWEAVGFDDSESGEVRRILRAKPGEALNLSTEEFSLLRTELGNVSASEPEAAAKVSAAYRKILRARLVAYVERGLDGVAAYDRGRGRLSSPATELRAIWDEDDAFMERYFPGFARAVARFPEGPAEGVEHVFYWLKEVQRDRPSFMLEHMSVLPSETFLLISLRRFFAGHSMNATQAVLLAVPDGEQTVLFLVNSVSTDQIVSLFSGLAVSIGQRTLRNTVEEFFTTLRENAAFQ